MLSFVGTLNDILPAVNESISTDVKLTGIYKSGLVLLVIISFTPFSLSLFETLFFSANILCLSE